MYFLFTMKTSEVLSATAGTVKSRDRQFEIEQIKDNCYYWKNKYYKLRKEYYSLQENMLCENGTSHLLTVFLVTEQRNRN